MLVVPIARLFVFFARVFGVCSFGRKKTEFEKISKSPGLEKRVALWRGWPRGGVGVVVVLMAEKRFLRGGNGGGGGVVLWA